METWMSQARESLLQRRSSLRALLSGGEVVVPPECSCEEGGEELSERERRELKDIEEALVRIEEGLFGHCARCGGAIGRHRLRAVPEARHCMACSAQVAR